MSSINIAALINFVGFTVGAALYAMLLVMALMTPPRVSVVGWRKSWVPGLGLSANVLLAATAVLGLLWNVGALATYGVKDFGVGEPLPFVTALSFTALGFLPAVVVHSALLGQQGGAPRAVGRAGRWIVVAAYGLSAAAGLMHFYSAAAVRTGHSNRALMTLTVGYLVVTFALALMTRHQPGWTRMVWATALAVFAVSALHLSQHSHGGPESWSVELLGHHASLPLVLAILYQDYRFAFADIFLKRALALVMLIAIALGLYVLIAAPLLMPGTASAPPNPSGVGALLALWVVTALLYPGLRRAAVWFVDSVLLRRADYAELKAGLARAFGGYEEPEAVLEELCRALAPALTAGKVIWSAADNAQNVEGEGRESADQDRIPAPAGLQKWAAAGKPGVDAGPVSQPADENLIQALGSGPEGGVRVFIPTAEPPYYHLTISEMVGGRRLLSGDIEMLEAVAVMAARRVDALRVAHERCEQVSREQEMSKLATEAQLRALRAQVNPHFLFNALTTISYLIKTAPDRALDTMMKLTELLRRVLRSNEDFVTLEEEMKLIASYLDIEKERFQERLRVRVDVPPGLLTCRLPPLLIQPLVENAIKHGITKTKFGGEVAVSASLEEAGERGPGARGAVLRVTVSDTGAGASEIELARGRRDGLGLSNVGERLRCYYGPQARLHVRSAPGEGTAVELLIPVAAVGGAGAEGDGLRPAAVAGRRNGG